MLVVVSPAKKLNEAPDNRSLSVPDFQADAIELARYARDLGARELGRLMDISDNLATLNASRFQAFGSQPKKPAIFAFAGDTYQGLDAVSLDSDALRWAQSHLCILSGLYGLLRPLDEIEPYRLQMGSRLKTDRGCNLYEWWGTKIAETLNERAQATGSRVLVNCASQEYFGAVDLSTLNLEVITPVFMEESEGHAKVVSFHAKRARGAMARFIVERRISDRIGLRSFDIGGYAYRDSLSTPEKLVFIRRI